MHCPKDSDWQERVLQRGTQIINASIKGLQQCS
jgi:hypothetical protein